MASRGSKVALLETHRGRHRQTSSPSFTNHSLPNQIFAKTTHSMPGEWSVGLCDCFGDFHTCCLTFWCPCVTFGRTAEIVDRGSTSCCMNGTLYYLLSTIGCQWLYGCTKRSSMRAQYNLQESPCLDCCVHFWCGPCALCQEYKELEKRGFNMAKGWEGSNKMVGCFHGMTTPPRKQSMCF